MKTKTRSSWLVLALAALGFMVAGFFSGEKKAEAVSGDWGIVKQAYLYDDCIYAVFAANQLDVTILAIGVRTQFFGSTGGSLGVWNLVAETNIPSFYTDVVGWRIPSICSSVDSAKIIKSVASY